MKDGASWSVVLVVPDRRGKMLVQARAFNARDLNFPGGDAEPTDGSPQQTAVRELLEETGLVAEPGNLHLIDTWTGSRGQPVYVFVVASFRGRARSSNEGKVFWTNKLNCVSGRLSTFGVYNARIVKKLIELQPAA